MPDIGEGIDLLSGGVDALQKWVEKFDGAANDPYFTPSEEPLQWREEIRGKVVPLRTAIMAMHIMVARCVFRSLPAIVEGKLRSTEKAAGKFAAKKGAGFVLKRLAVPIGFALDLVDLWDRVKLEKEMESAIRRASLRTMREVKDTFLKTKHRVRRRDYVYTRKRTVKNG